MITLNRIILFGNDIKGLKHFYQSNFHLPLLEEIENEWVVLDAGAVEIAFHRIGPSYRTNKPFKAESNIKLVFNIDDQMNSFREKLIKSSVNMKEIKSFEGADFLCCDGEDIEGNIFQLYQSKK